MEKLNQSKISEFILLGLTSSQDIQFLLFVLVSVIYMATVLGNLVIVITEVYILN